MTATPTPLRDLPAKWREQSRNEATEGKNKEWAEWVRERHMATAAALWKCADELEAALSARGAGACNCASGRGAEHCVVHAPNDVLPSIATPPASGEAEAWDSLAIAHLLDERASDRGGDKLLTDAAALIRRLAAVAPPAASADDLLEKWCDRYNELIRADRTYEAEQVLRCINEATAAKHRRLAAVAPAGMDGMAMVPRHLTAENGAKAALIGEFSFRDGSGREHDVPWHVIKQIHRRVVETFASTTPPATAGKE